MPEKELFPRRDRQEERVRRQPEESAQPSERKEQEPRVTVTGRLGRTPIFHRSQRGILVGRFPLAIHDESGGTTWRRVLVFRERAERLQQSVRSDAIVKGTEVDVVGYVHEHEVKGTRGTRTVQEIYAVVVNPRSKPAQSKP